MDIEHQCHDSFWHRRGFDTGPAEAKECEQQIATVQGFWFRIQVEDSREKHRSIGKLAMTLCDFVQKKPMICSQCVDSRGRTVATWGQAEQTLRVEGRVESIGGLVRRCHRASNCTIRFVLFLYMIRCPHSLHRIGSLDLISFFAPQSAHRYSISCLGAGMKPVPVPFPFVFCVPG